MDRYIIERRLPGAGKLSPDALCDISAKSNEVLAELGREGEQIQWVQSFVSEDAIHCVYLASSPELIQEHARRGGFPADSIQRVNVIDPTTGR